MQSPKSDQLVKNWAFITEKLLKKGTDPKFRLVLLLYKSLLPLEQKQWQFYSTEVDLES